MMVTEEGLPGTVTCRPGRRPISHYYLPPLPGNQGGNDDDGIEFEFLDYPGFKHLLSTFRLPSHRFLNREDNAFPKGSRLVHVVIGIELPLSELLESPVSRYLVDYHSNDFAVVADRIGEGQRENISGLMATSSWDGTECDLGAWIDLVLEGLGP